jgi:hypothetical protein
MFSLRWFMSLGPVAPVRGPTRCTGYLGPAVHGGWGPPVPTEALTRYLNHWFHYRTKLTLSLCRGTRAHQRRIAAPRMSGIGTKETCSMR